MQVTRKNKNKPIEIHRYYTKIQFEGISVIKKKKKKFEGISSANILKGKSDSKEINSKPNLLKVN